MRAWVATIVAVTTLAGSGHASGQSVIWDNGPIITQANAGCPADPTPHHDSALQNGAPVNAGSFGFSCRNTTNRLSDDFLLLGSTTVSSLTVYAYQTLASPPSSFPPTSTINGMFVRIWRGRPDSPGSTVVFGDTTTNRLSSTTFSGIYRSAAAGAFANSCLRPVMTATAEFNPPLALSAGQYWIDYGLTGTLAGAPFSPPVTTVAAWHDGNSRQFIGSSGVWLTNTDSANGRFADLPFVLKGNACSLPLSCSCPGDVAPNGGNNVVDVIDLLAVIGVWNQNGQPQGPRPPGDTAPLPNGDCLVDVKDLLGVIADWGPCPAPVGACCHDDGLCRDNETAASCLKDGGVYQGDCTTCEGVFCPTRPANDACENAQLVAAGHPGWDNTYATTDGPEGDPGNGCEDAITRDVWFNYQAVQDGAVILNTIGSEGNLDTVLAVYDTWACPLGDLLGCNDDVAGGPPNTGYSALTIPVKAGQQIKIRVGSFGGGPEGAGTLNISEFDNDICGGAQPVGVPSVTGGSLADATFDVDAPSCDAVPPGSGKWYTVMGNGNTLVAHTCDGPSQLWDGQISVFCGFGCKDLTCVAASDENSCNLGQESVSWCSAAGQQYWILVHSDDAPAGSFDLTIENGSPCKGAVPCGCFQCPVGAVDEGEVCLENGSIDETNGGCNVTPAVFGSISANGPAICGLGSTYVAGSADARDLDWYLFTVPVAGTYRVQGNSTFPANFFIIGNAAGNITTCGTTSIVPDSLVSSPGDACLGEVTSGSVNLNPGTYAVVVGPQALTGVPCTPDYEHNRYYVRLLAQ